MNLIFDIGYNNGSFTKECLRIYPDCKVIGVEANPHLIKKPTSDKVVLLNNLVSNVSDHNIDFFIEHNQTGISTASNKYLYESRFAKGSENLPPNSARWSAPIKINSITLDDLIKNFGFADLIKIDVEGYEYEVISGLSNKCNKICFEWHEEDLDTALKCVDHLIKIGYDQFGIIGYFKNRDILSQNITHSDLGDPYLVEPNSYHMWQVIKNDLFSVCDKERRINYGMLFAK